MHRMVFEDRNASATIATSATSATDDSVVSDFPTGNTLLHVSLHLP